MNDRPTSPQPAPVEPGARIQVIDVLRGFALLGVLVMNMAGYTGSYETMERWTQLDQWLNWAAHFLFEAKFYSLFSFLFGLGMAMQLLRAEARGTRFMPVYLRRLFILLLIGMAHATFLWTGDILFIYACCGFLLLLFRKLPPKTILIGALLVLLHPIIISLPHVSPAFYEAFGRATEGLRAMIPGDEQIYTTGTYFQVTMHRFWEANMGRLVIAFAFGNVFAMFLLGLFAGRQKIFQRLAEHLPLIRRVMWVTLVLGVLLNGLYVYFIIHPDYVAEDWQPLARRGLRTVAAPSLCLFYISAIILLYQSQTWRLRLDDLAPLGRMALTNYLLQSLVMTTIFYGYGLGIYGEFGPTGDLVLALIFYGLQIRFSAWWLERYRFGPAEWAWRSLTYGRLQPWRADVEAGQAVPARPKVALAAIAVLLPLGFTGFIPAVIALIALYALMGLCLAGFFGTMFWAAHRATALSMAALFVSIPLLAYSLGRGLGVEPRAGRLLAILVIGAVGALGLAWAEAGTRPGALRFGIGEAVFFLGCVSTALYPVLSKWGLDRGWLSQRAALRTFWSLVIGGVLIGLAGLVWEAPRALAAMTLSDALLLGYLGVFSSGVTFWLLQRATSVLTPGTVTAYTYLVPSVSMLLLFVEQPQQIGWHWLPGSLLVVLAITLLLRRDGILSRM